MEKQEEEWRPIPRWPDHEASSLGRIRRSPTAERFPDCVLKTYERGDSYRVVHMVVTVHSLVAEAFHGQREKGKVVNHRNHNRADNRSENLEWVTSTENNYDVLQGVANGRAALTEAQVLRVRQEYRGRWGEQTMLARRYGVSPMLISKIVRGEIWTHLAGGDAGYDPTAGRVRGSRKNVRRNQPKAEAHGRAKLSDQDVSEIKARCKAGFANYDTLAQQYGVKRAVIRDIARGKRWKHIK